MTHVLLSPQEELAWLLTSTTSRHTYQHLPVLDVILKAQQTEQEYASKGTGKGWQSRVGRELSFKWYTVGQHWKFAKEHWKALFPGGSARAEPGPRMEGILRVRTDLACLLYTPASTLRPDVLLRDVWQSLADATGDKEDNADAHAQCSSGDEDDKQQPQATTSSPSNRQPYQQGQHLHVASSGSVTSTGSAELTSQLRTASGRSLQLATPARPPPPRPPPPAPPTALLRRASRAEPLPSPFAMPPLSPPPPPTDTTITHTHSQPQPQSQPKSQPAHRRSTASSNRSVETDTDDVSWLRDAYRLDDLCSTSLPTSIGGQGSTGGQLSHSGQMSNGGQLSVRGQWSHSRQLSAGGQGVSSGQISAEQVSTGGQLSVGGPWCGQLSAGGQGLSSGQVSYGGQMSTGCQVSESGSAIQEPVCHVVAGNPTSDASIVLLPPPAELGPAWQAQLQPEQLGSLTQLRQVSGGKPKSSSPPRLQPTTSKSTPPPPQQMGPQATLDAALDSGQVEVVWTAEGSQGGTPDKSAQQASQAGSCPQSQAVATTHALACATAAATTAAADSMQPSGEVQIAAPHAATTGALTLPSAPGHTHSPSPFGRQADSEGGPVTPAPLLTLATQPATLAHCHALLQQSDSVWGSAIARHKANCVGYSGAQVEGTHNRDVGDIGVRELHDADAGGSGMQETHSSETGDIGTQETHSSHAAAGDSAAHRTLNSSGPVTPRVKQGNSNGSDSSAWHTPTSVGSPAQPAEARSSGSPANSPIVLQLSCAADAVAAAEPGGATPAVRRRLGPVPCDADISHPTTTTPQSGTPHVPAVLHTVSAGGAADTGSVGDSGGAGDKACESECSTPTPPHPLAPIPKRTIPPHSNAPGHSSATPFTTHSLGSLTHTGGLSEQQARVGHSGPHSSGPFTTSQAPLPPLLLPVSSPPRTAPAAAAVGGPTARAPLAPGRPQYGPTPLQTAGQLILGGDGAGGILGLGAGMLRSSFSHFSAALAWGKAPGTGQTQPTAGGDGGENQGTSVAGARDARDAPLSVTQAARAPSRRAATPPAPPLRVSPEPLRRGAEVVGRALAAGLSPARPARAHSATHTRTQHGTPVSTTPVPALPASFNPATPSSTISTGHTTTATRLDNSSVAHHVDTTGSLEPSQSASPTRARRASAGARGNSLYHSVQVGSGGGSTRSSWWW